MENVMTNNLSVPIVIPSYEPDDRLITLLNELDSKGMGPVVIVNDGSGEEYDPVFKEAEAIIKKLGGVFISYRPNQGKGHALKTAFAYIRDNMPEAIGCVTADSDGQHSPACIASLIDALKVNRDSLILGVRKFNKKEIPWKSWAGNNITIKVFSYVSGLKVSDTQTGLRGIPRKFMIELIDCKGERFEYEIQMLLECAGKYDLVEIPIETIYDSKENHQTHFNPWKDSVRIYKILLKKFFKYIFASVTSFIIDILLFTLLTHLFEANFPDTYIIISTVGARVVSATYNYLINYFVVFKSHASKRVALAKYALVAITQMALSAGIVTLIMRLFPNAIETIVKVIVDMILFFVVYSVQQRLVFGTSKKSHVTTSSKE